MISTRKAEVSTIVLEAIRKHLAVIECGIQSYYEDSSKSEEIDESIRRTRIAKCATAIIGSPTLNRLLSFQEDILESLAFGREKIDDETLSLLVTMVSATHCYVDLKSSLNPPNDDALNSSRETLARSVKAYRRFRNLPDADDDRAILDLFRGSRDLGDEPLGTGTQECGSVRKVGAREASGSDEPASGLADAGQLECDEIAPELLEIFQEEAEDHINKIYAGLRKLEKSPGDREHIQDVRRAAHTFKGAAGAVGLSDLSKLSHRMEDILDGLYDGGLSLTREHLTLLLDTTDVLQDCCLGDGGNKDARTRIVHLCSAYDSFGKRPDAAATGLQGSGKVKEPSPMPITPSDDATDSEAIKSSSARTLRVPSDRIDEVCNVVGELMINRTSLEQIIERFTQCVDEIQPVLDRLKDVSHQLETKYEVPALWSQGELKADQHSEFDELELDRYTDFHLLSRSLSEATSDSSAISHQLSTAIGDFQTLVAHQNRLTRDAQSRLLQIRMVPFGSLTSRLTRALRQVADHEQKEVELVIGGEQTELDKTVLEELVDPLLHLLRNSVDHGVETADVREANGKPATARVRVCAYHDGTQVVIEISDDGRGLDLERIRSRVVRGGYLDAEDAKALSSHDLFPYIFIPGFSTAPSVSEISGRGVGMDIVRCNIEKLNGRIDVQSSAGEGTTFTIRLPTTLIVTRALIATAGYETFAIPTHAVAKVVNIDLEQSDLDQGEGAQVRVDGRLYPLMRLDNHLEFTPVRAGREGALTAAIVQLGESTVALSFDTILSTRDIVVKSLGSHLGHVRGLLGATVMGDGAVVPILDPSAPRDDGDGFARRHSACDFSDWEWEDISVMIVDDSVSVRRVLSNLIKRSDWTPLTARDGLDALEIIGGLEHPPHAILLDVEMPRMDGYELLSTLRAKPEFEGVPIIMITSRGGDKHRKKAIELGATAYVVKPIQDEPLLQLIRRHIKQSRKQ